MNIEVFSHSKYKNSRLPGDDVVLIEPDLVLAVFDGATDPTGVTYGGETSGRIAARAAARCISELAHQGALVPSSASEIFRRVNDRIAEAAGLRRFTYPPSTTAAIVVDAGAAFRVIVFGDSGVRINGAQIHQQHKLIDAVSTHARIMTRNLLSRRAGNPDRAEMATRRVIFAGLSAAVEDELITAGEAAAILQHTSATTGVDANLVAEFLEGGIRTQFRYANRLDRVLGYTTLNGMEIPEPDMIDMLLDKSEIDSLEIFSDGYVSVPEKGVAVADWEREFARVEVMDFQKIGAHKAIKGSTSDEYCDDRSVICATQ